MKILYCCILLYIFSCSQQKEVSGSKPGSDKFKNKNKVLPVKLFVESNMATDAIREITRKKISEKNINVLNEAEFKDLVSKQLKEAFRTAGGKDINTLPDPGRLNSAIKSAEQTVNCVSLYCVIKKTYDQTLVFDSLRYSESKFPVPKDTKRIDFDLEGFQDKSLLPVLDSLVNYLFRTSN